MIARSRKPYRRSPGAIARLTACALLSLATAATSLRPAQADEKPVQLNIVGGLGGVSQYTQLEEPFWSREIEAKSGGRIQATIKPFDRSGIQADQMLQLMRLGVVPFGNVLLAVAASDDPELNTVELPVLNPDFASLRRTLDAFRDHLRDILKSRYNIELLGVYSYPAQVTFCTRPFGGLDDLAGRKVRVSSVGQLEMVRALNATPVMVPFAEIVKAVKTGAVDCAITGTLSGNEIGLSEVTTHVHALAITWGVSIFGANMEAWNALPPDVRKTIRDGVRELEDKVIVAADKETAHGLACDLGQEPCSGRLGHMTLVPVSAADEARRRRLLAETVLPAWIKRCGPACVATWNDDLARTSGITLGEH